MLGSFLVYNPCEAYVGMYAHSNIHVNASDILCMHATGKLGYVAHNSIIRQAYCGLLHSSLLT